MNELLSFLDSIYPLSEGMKEYLVTKLVRKEIHKKGFILKQGSVSENIYFIEKGLVRCFYIKDEKEVSSWFISERDVIISVESFFGQKESCENIQALEDCVVYYLGYKELQYAYDTFPEFNFIGRVLLEKYNRLNDQKLYSLRVQKAPEKFQYLMKHFPQIILRVPSRYIAPYLGITEETLNRMLGRKD